MKIVKERTRLIFSDYDAKDVEDLKKLVSTIDNTFIYEDETAKRIYLPVGMETDVTRVFRLPVDDKSASSWQAATIEPPVDKYYEPRNQMQIDSIDFTLNAARRGQKIGLILPPGSGKALANSTKIPTPTGTKRMGELQVGDTVFGSDGSHVKVLRVYPNGERDIYRITFSDGRLSQCDLNHLWSIRNDDTGDELLTTEGISAKLSRWQKCQMSQLSRPVEYQEMPTEIDAYTVGRLIKSGELLTIPAEHIFNSVEHRIELIRGLMDLQGEIDDDLTTVYRCDDETVLSQFQTLIWGFGYIARKSGNTVIVECPISFKRQLFSLPEKLARFDECDPVSETPYTSELWISDISFSHREEATCILVDAPNHLFLTENFIVTHNTYVACYCAVKVGLRTLIIAPTIGVRDQWLDSLITMMKISPARTKLITSGRGLIEFDGDFAITLQATIAGMIKQFDVERLIRDKRFGTKIIDETHMFFNNIIRVDGSMNVKQNWYLTATFGRSNEEEDRLYHQMFGDIKLFRVRDKAPTIFNRKPGDIYGQKPHMNVTMLWLNGGLTRDEIGSVANATRYGISLPKYTSLIIPEDGKRTRFVNSLIKTVKISDTTAPYGRTLILTATIASVETMAKHLREEFPNRLIGTIHSKNDKASNDKVKAESEIIISTVKSSGTGFDVKDLSKLIVAEQFKSAILAEQVSGRLRRRADGRDTYMYDIVDRSIRQLRVWGAARAQLLKRKSKKFTVTNM